MHLDRQLLVPARRVAPQSMAPIVAFQDWRASVRLAPGAAVRPGLSPGLQISPLLQLKAGEVEAVLRWIETTCRDLRHRVDACLPSFLGEKVFELEEDHGASQGRNVITVVLVISRCSNKLSLYQKGFEMMKDSVQIDPYFMFLNDDTPDSGFVASS